MIRTTKMPANMPTYYMNGPKLNRHKPGKIDSNMRVPNYISHDFKCFPYSE